MNLGKVRRYMHFVRDFLQIRRMMPANSRLPLRWRDRRACLYDAGPTLQFDRHYTYHPAWAARILASLCPERHIDIGSDLRFVANVSAFVPVDYYDYRSPSLALDGVYEGVADLCRLPFADRSVKSLSCMHVVEHVGLGRYGDSVQPDGDLKAMSELARVVAPEGNLLFVVPLGSPRIEFNAHRVYAMEMITEQFEQFELIQFSLIPDDPADGGLVPDPKPELLARQRYGCGCFWLRKKK